MVGHSAASVSGAPPRSPTTAGPEAAAASCIGSTSTSPVVRRCTPGVPSVNRTPRATDSGSVNGSYHVVEVFSRAPRLVCAGLDGHHCQIAPSRLREQGCQIGCVLGVDQSARVDRQHHAVEVEATHCRQLGGGGAEVVAGDADEAHREALVAGTQNGLDGWAPTIELGHVGDAVSLVQVERVAAESLQRRLDLSRRPSGLVRFDFSPMNSRALTAGTSGPTTSSAWP